MKGSRLMDPEPLTLNSGSVNENVAVFPPPMGTTVGDALLI